MKLPFRAFISMVLLALLATGGRAPQAEAGVPYHLFLPLVIKPYACPASSGAKYAAGGTLQYDQDNPPRPAGAHADKNLALRGYTLTSAPLTLLNLGPVAPVLPPQFATLFSPARLPAFSAAYRSNNWAFDPSPAPGHATTPISSPAVTVLGLTTTPGEALHVPDSGSDIGGDMEVLVIYADADSLALKYTREDSAATGYTVHIDNICTNPQLLAVYNNLDTGARYVYHGAADGTVDYNLPNLSALAVFGTARGTEIRVAIVDTGGFQDPRSCNDWWQTVGCP